MILNPKDYTDYTKFLSAVLLALQEEGQVYVNKVNYDLDRACDREDYMINLLNYVDVNNDNAEDINLDYNPFPGFEDYDPPASSFPVFYVTGLYTAIDPQVTSYNPGEPLDLELVGTNANAPLNDLQVGITVSFNNMDLEDVTTTWTYSSTGQTGIDFPTLESYVGPITVTTFLVDAESQPVILVYSGQALSLPSDHTAPNAIRTIDIRPPGSDIVTSQQVVPDMDGLTGITASDDGLFTSNNFYDAYNSRLAASKHLTATLGATTYSPALNGASLAVSIAKANTPYTYTVNGVEITGQPKPNLAYYDIQVSLEDEDHNPVGSVVINEPAQNDYVQSIDLDNDFTGALYVVLSVTAARNEVFLPQDPVTGLSLSFGGTDQVTTWEPGETITITTLLATTDGYNDLPVYSNLFLSLLGFPTSELSGSAVMSDTLNLTNPGTGNFDTSFATGITEYDGPLYLKFVQTIPGTVINSLFVYVASQEVVSITDFATVSFQYDYYDTTDLDTPITITLTSNDGTDLSQVFANISAFTTLPSSPLTGNSIQIAVNSGLQTSYTITPSDLVSAGNLANIALQFEILN